MNITHIRGDAEADVLKWMNFRFVPGRRLATSGLCRPPASKAGTDRRPFKFWTVLRRWTAGLYPAAVRKQAAGAWMEPRLENEIAKQSMPGGKRMGQAMARSRLTYSVKLMFLLRKKTKLVAQFGRKVCTVDRISAIQSGHAFNQD